MEFLTIFYMLFLILLIFIVSRYYKIRKRIDIFVVFSLVYAVYYLTVPVIYFLFENSINYHNDYIWHIKNATLTDRSYALIYTIIGYCLFCVGFFLTPLYKKQKISIRDLSNINKKKLMNVFIFFGMFMFIVGGISFLIIIINLGGLLNALYLADFLRNPNVDNTQYLSQNVLFFMTLGGLLLGAPYAFFGLVVLKRKVVYKLLFTVTFIVGFIYALFAAGKFVLATYVGGFLLHYLISKRKAKLLIISILGLLSVLLVPLLDGVFAYLAGGGERSFEIETVDGVAILGQYSFPYSNLINIQNMNELFGLRWGIDLINWTWNVLPSIIVYSIGLTFTEGLSRRITTFYGTFNYQTGGTPADMLTFVLSQFSVAGLFIMSFVGMLFKKLNGLLEQLDFNDFLYIYIAILVLPYSMVFNFEMVNVIKYRIDNVTLVIMLILVHLIFLKNKIQLEGNKSNN